MNIFQNQNVWFCKVEPKLCIYQQFLLWTSDFVCSGIMFIRNTFLLSGNRSDGKSFPPTF